jgi:hypothetical protein
MYRAKLTLLHVLQHHRDTEEYYLSGDPEARARLQGTLIAFPAGFDPDTGGPFPMPRASQPVVVHRDHLEETRNQLRNLVPPTF